MTDKELNDKRVSLFKMNLIQILNRANIGTEVTDPIVSGKFDEDIKSYIESGRDVREAANDIITAYRLKKLEKMRGI